MSGRFTITIDPGRKLLGVQFIGFFDPADLAGYEKAKNGALARLGCGPNEHVTLCDFSACGPQSQDILDLFARSLGDPLHRSRRLAVVVSTTLAAFQVRRMVTRADARCFRTVASAEEWLCHD